jgi:protocatechuate 3,4-dioxygenase, beta subunit
MCYHKAMVTRITRNLIQRPRAAGSSRNFIQKLSLGTALFTTHGLFAEELTRKTRTKTSAVEEGPFYPPKLPLDTDNDLIIVNDSITPAVGEIAHLSGCVLDLNGEPIRNATVEIWSVDHDDGAHGNWTTSAHLN